MSLNMLSLWMFSMSFLCEFISFEVFIRTFEYSLYTNLFFAFIFINWRPARVHKWSSDTWSEILFVFNCLHCYENTFFCFCCFIYKQLENNSFVIFCIFEIKFLLLWSYCGDHLAISELQLLAYFARIKHSSFRSVEPIGNTRFFSTSSGSLRLALENFQSWNIRIHPHYMT